MRLIMVARAFGAVVLGAVLGAMATFALIGAVAALLLGATLGALAASILGWHVFGGDRTEPGGPLSPSTGSRPAQLRG